MGRLQELISVRGRKIDTLPNWAQDRMVSLAYQVIELEEQQEAHKTLEEGKHLLEDPTRRDAPEEGRYGGDLHAELDVLPGLRRPYRVTVWYWDSRTHFNKDGSPVGWAGGDLMHTIYDVPRRYKEERSFKSAYAAALHLGAVRAFADSPVIAQRAGDAIESGRTRIA